jgi:hypothetical protein
VDANEDHRARIERLRRWEAEQRRAQETQALQREAAQRKRQQTARKAWTSRVGMVLMGLGLVVGSVHLIRHLIANPRSLEDLAVGYPTAGGLLILGLILLGTR